MKNLKKELVKASHTLNVLMDILHLQISSLAINMSSRRLIIHSRHLVKHMNGQSKDLGLTESHMEFVYSKEKTAEGLELSHTENCMGGHSGGKILMGKERHTNASTMETQLALREYIAVKMSRALLTIIRKRLPRLDGCALLDIIFHMQGSSDLMELFRKDI
jgi:hypothetical protein